MSEAGKAHLKRRDAEAPRKPKASQPSIIPIVVATPRNETQHTNPSAPRRLGVSNRRQHQRLLWQAGFFVLFIMAPVFDLFRYDLVAGHAWFLGMPWKLGIADFQAGHISAGQAALNLLVRLFLPILATGGVLLYVSWRWGRLYCGWLCPHFSVVETINALMRRASGKQSLWDRSVPTLPDGRLRQANGHFFRVDARWWFATLPLAVAFAFLWAVVLLTYLLPPFEVYGNLLHGTPTRNQFVFITAGTIALSVEFLFARHLFCRYACAVGLFQSLAWMANRGAMVVGFERMRAADCTACREVGGAGYSACDQVCPMRLKPRSVKQSMFTCTQCAQCVSACETVQGDRPSLLTWVADEAARQNEATMSLTGKRD